MINNLVIFTCNNYDHNSHYNYIDTIYLLLMLCHPIDITIIIVIVIDLMNVIIIDITIIKMHDSILL